MEEMSNFRGFGGQKDTLIHPIVALIAAFACAYLLFCRRDRILPTIILVSVITPISQFIVIFGSSFTILRILVLCAWMRFLVRRDYVMPRWSTIDKLMIAWALSNCCAYILLWQATGAAVNRAAFLLESLGSYLLFRIYCRNIDGLKQILRVLVWAFCLTAVCMTVEQLTGRNPFSMLGGVPELSEVRDGHVRAQGPFPHTLLAGTFGAVGFSLGLVLIRSTSERDRRWGKRGVIAGAIIALSAFSSSPLFALMTGVFVTPLFRFRRFVKHGWYSLLAVVVLLHLVMKAPVWSLIGRVTLFSASTGYHRYILIDNFIRHFDEWWLFGTKSTAQWGFGMWDITNAYIDQGVTGGLLTFVLFISLIGALFRALGRSLFRNSSEEIDQRFLWALGVALLTFCVAFLGTTIWGQINLIFFFLIAAIATVTSTNPFRVRSNAIAEPAHELSASGFGRVSPAGV